jgi:hypothetical protein
MTTQTMHRRGILIRSLETLGAERCGHLLRNFLFGFPVSKSCTCTISSIMLPDTGQLNPIIASR